MASEKNLIHLLKAQINAEKGTSEKIEELEEFTSNLAAKLFLVEMRFDTEKHAKILQTLLDIVEERGSARTTTKFWQIETHEYVEASAARQRLENHVAVETSMLESVKEMIKKTDDEAVKMLFDHILMDERKHHKILENILEKAFKMKSLP